MTEVDELRAKVAELKGQLEDARRIAAEIQTMLEDAALERREERE
jgi:predicted component of type VI protein secretion system